MLRRHRPWLILLGALATGPACGLSEFPRPDAGNGPAVAPGIPPVFPSPDAAPNGADPPPSARDAGARDSGSSRPRDAGSSRPSDAGSTPRPDMRMEPPAAPTPPPGPLPPGDLVIGGQPFSKDKVIVFLHFGHSNMAGRTDTPIEARPFHFETHPRLLSFRGAVWQLAKEPLSGDYLTRGRAGPGMSILRTAQAIAPQDAVIVSIGFAQDGSRAGKCASYRKGGVLYENVMGPARQLKGKVTFAGIISMLVLMDVFGDKGQLPRANECHEAVAADMRADLGEPQIPFIMSDWEMGATGRFRPTTPDAMLARERLRVAQMNIQRSFIVPTENLPMSDDHHFDLNGYKMWAERLFVQYQQNGWATWAAPAP